MPLHRIEDMLAAINLILLYDDAATPIQHTRSTGIPSTIDLRLVYADMVNKTQHSGLKER